MAFEPEARPWQAKRARPEKRLSFETRLRTWLYILCLPVFGLGLTLCLQNDVGWIAIAVWAAVGGAAWALAVSLLVEQIVRPLQTLSNVVAALREDDYSFRARGARRNDAMGDLALEVNALAGLLQAQRAGALEAMALVERVMESMQSPVLAFDPEKRLRLLNAAGEKVFGIRTETALGRHVDDLDLGRLLTTDDGELVSLGAGELQADRWVMKRASFRLRGIPHTLLMFSEVSAALREEERQAWKRLIRVLGHEINNSLTPIKSIAGSLRGRLLAAEAGSDFERGLAVIEDRSESLNRFLQAYQQLMGLPVPKPSDLSVRNLVERSVHLETNLKVTLVESEDLTLRGDPDQLQQALINLVRNAVESALDPDASGQEPPMVAVGWKHLGDEVVISIRDNGCGLSNETNLFVPFYTTKPGGTGIGLVLAQQIAEAHRGSLRLVNRTDGPGCIASLRIPLQAGI